MRSEYLDKFDYQRVHFDSYLLFCAIMLVGFGCIMNYSASAVLAGEKFGDSLFFLKRTLVFAAVGFAFMAFVSRVPYECYRRLVYPIMVFVLFMVLAVFIPGVGRKIGGATRWIAVGPVSFQPSELAKIAMVIFLAYSLEKKAASIRSFGIGFLSHVVFMAVVAACIFLQRDMGAAMTIAMITFIVMYVAGVRLYYLIGMCVAVVPVGALMVLGAEYRRQRIMAFLNPWSDQYGSGFQMIQSFVAFNEGGFFGQGLGQGQQKLFYLPEAHTDFILSVIGEELGMLGVLLVVGLFGFFCYRGMRIALMAPDLFGRYLGLGCTLIVVLQAVLNMAVVMGLMPTKGLALPFISYGGSSLVASLLAVGILLNLSTYRRVDSNQLSVSSKQ